MQNSLGTGAQRSKAVLCPAVDDAGGRSTRGIHQLFEAQAARTPNAIAVVFGDTTLTYADLDARANQLAHYLRRHGIQRDSLVALGLDRSLELPVAILGTLKAGGACLPLDPAYPDERLAFMVADARPVLVLTQEKYAGRFAAALPAVRLDVDGFVLDDERQGRCDASVTPLQLAYVIYTSGSTGTPKAVLLHHSGLVNQNLAVIDLFGLTTRDRVGQCSSLSFDMAVEEIFPTWLSGGTVVFHPATVVGAGEELSAWVEQHQITVLNLPTALWHGWVADLSRRGQRPPDSLRLVMVAGQRASPSMLADWQALAGDSMTWINGYGPTETTVGVSFFEISSSSAWDGRREIPIGAPIQGIRAYVLNHDGSPCAVGATGELFLGGAGLARGYLNRPALTAERFLPDPFAEVPGQRMYRTGDLARRRADGVLEFGGRIDDQLKIRGFRVEPGEVEEAIRRHRFVRDAVVLGWPDVDGTMRLTAYLVLAGAAPDALIDIAQSLRRTLPDFMVPSDYVILEGLPLTPNGKVDKRQLARPPRSREHLAAPYVAPVTESECGLAAIWSSVLGIERIGVHDHFLELGAIHCGRHRSPSGFASASVSTCR